MAAPEVIEEIEKLSRLSVHELQSRLQHDLKLEGAGGGGEITGNIDVARTGTINVDVLIRQAFDRTMTDLKLLICQELRYCERRNKEYVSLVVAIADAKLIGLLGLPFPPAKLAVYLVKSQILDGFCECR